MSKKSLAILVLLWAPISEAAILRYTYRVRDSSADPTARLPQLILADTEAECPSADVGDGDLCYGKDTDDLLVRTASAWADVYPAAGGGAPTDAEYVVGALHGSLSAERLGTNTLSVMWDFGTAGQAKVVFNYSDAGADPALATEECVFSNEGASAGGWVCEGTTADTIETRFRVTDPTVTDRIVTIPDADSTTVQPDAGAANNFLTAISGVGVVSKAQPSFSNLSGTAGDGQVDGSLEADEVNPTLGTQTQGNYVQEVQAGLGLSESGSPAEPATSTVSIDHAQTLVGNPALNADECVHVATATGGGLLCEGGIADANEMLFLIPDLSEADTTHRLATESATQTLTNKTLVAADNAIEADTGDSATGFFGAGALEVARGGTGAAPGADDQVLVSDSTSAATWRGVPNCNTENMLTYSTSTNTFGCEADAGAGAGGDNIRVEDGDNGGTFTAMTDADFEDSGDINFVRTAGVPDLITGLVRADAVALGTDTTNAYVADLTGGDGIAVSGGGGETATVTVNTQSDETGFLEDLGAGDLTCGASTAGKMAVNDADALQYCDGTATPARRTAAFADDAGNALAGDSATAFFGAGQIEAARGGTGDDTSATTGEPRISSGNWTYFTESRTKSITIESPTATENIAIWQTDVAITLNEVRSVCRGTTPSVTWNIRHNTDRSAATADLFSANQVTTSTTTGDTDNSGFTDQSAAASEWIWFISSAQSGTVTECNWTIEYSVD